MAGRNDYTLIWHSSIGQDIEPDLIAATQGEMVDANVLAVMY